MAAGHPPPYRARFADALLAGYPDVLRDPTLRGLFLVLLFGGSASGMALAYTAVWASQTFGLGPQAVGVLFVVSGVAGAIGNPLIGFLSDRIGRRRPFVIGQLLVGAVALTGYTFAQSYWLGLFLVAFSGFGVMGLTLTIVGDVVRNRPELAGVRGLRVLSTERTAWAMGIIVGPAAAAAIVTATGDVRLVFPGAALLEVLAAWLAWSVPDPPRGARAGDGAEADRWSRGRLFALGVLGLGLILVALPAQVRNMYLPLFITQVLAEPPGAVGPAFTINAITAVIAMPYMGALANRIGPHRVLYLSIGVGFTYCLLQSRATSYPVTFAIQCLMGLTISLWSTGGLIYLQQLLPGRGGVAGGLYLTVQQMTPVVSGLALGPIAERLGVPAAFSTAALLLVAAALLLVPSHRALTRPAPTRNEPARAGAAVD